MNIEDVAKCCYEANRTLWAVYGHSSRRPWPEAKDWLRDNAVRGVEYYIKNPDAPDSAFHDMWCVEKRASGWVQGPVKDTEAKTHPSLVPFDYLPPEQQIEDALFSAICRVLIPLIRLDEIRSLYNPELVFEGKERGRTERPDRQDNEKRREQG